MIYIQNYRKTALASLALVIFAGYFYFSHSTPPGAARLKEQTFDHLKNALDTRRQRAVSYLEDQKDSAINIIADPIVLARFQELNGFFLTKNYYSTRVFEIDHALQEMFVTKLGNFYDMLFVNSDGDFFYTVKKENDYGKNIGHAQFSGLSLQKRILERKFSFIDYEYYSASKEPASFYLFPIYANKRFLGHIVLQLSINRINDIFVDRSNLGKTGEVYLVNNSQMMLTDSRFIDTSTVLNKRIDTVAIKKSKNLKKGRQIIEDYRGKRVFSVFENFKFEDVDWIIVSEIDEDEILSKYYEKYESSFYPALYNSLTTEINDGKKAVVTNDFGDNFRKVDVKEFVKTKNDAGLYTKGVATCTAFAVQHSNQFSYLAHLSPTDASYNDDWLQQYVLGDQYTNYIDVIMRRIQHYDVRPHELSNLKFSIAAPENTAFRGIIRRLLNHGIFLNQISIHHKPGQYSMDMILNHKSGKVDTVWYDNQQSGRHGISFSGTNLLSLFKQHIGYQS